MEIRILKYGSEDYRKMVLLRTEILRKPLGLSFTREQLESESSDFLIGAFEGIHLVGCCILTPKEDQTVQFRQMAVAKNLQGKGIGAKLLKFAEQTSLQYNFAVLKLHARKEAIGFYERFGYDHLGPEFMEVGIRHQEMRKELESS